MRDIPPDSPSHGRWPELGAEVVSCRRLKGTRSLAARGIAPFNAWLEFYFITPVSCLFLPVLALGFTLVFVGESGLDTLGRPALVTIVLLVAGVLCWFAYFWPRYDYFVLYENGLRIRIGFKRLDTRLESITRLWGTMPDSLIEAEYERLGRYYNREPAIEERSVCPQDAGYLCVQLANGRTRKFPVLARFEPEDVARLLVAMQHQAEGSWPDSDA